jgi:hypothetical protein
VPGWRERTLADADRICDHVVRLLGSDALVLRDGPPTAAGYRPIPWHQDLTSGYTWRQRTFYRQISVPHGRADIKVPWELSRCQHLPTLGIAHLASGEARYAAEVVAQIDDWIDANPPGYGVNWAATMEVAIRAINWLWAVHLIGGAPELSDEFLTRFLASLLAHARHISANIELYDGGLTTNHTLADHAGLLHLGLALADLPEAAAWIEEAMAGLEQCMATQVAADGVDFENSIPYHRLVLEMLAACHLLAERNGRHFSADYRTSLRRMFTFVLHYTRPDGLAPVIGDSDDGRLFILGSYFDWQPQDHRYLLALGSVVFADEELAGPARSVPGAVEEAGWLLGAGAVARLAAPFPSPAAPPSRAFAPSGRYVMRSGGHHAVICADEVGTAGLGNHKHNDILSFELSVGGVAMVVDGGSYLYTSDPAWRERFRSTRAHNTVVVDGREQNEMTGPFGMRPDARVEVRAWDSRPDRDLFCAEHTGYARLPEPVIHRRRMVMAKHPFAWLVLDELLGRGEHEIESFLHFAPGGELGAVALERPALARELEAVGVLAGIDGLPDGIPAHGFAYARGGTEILVTPLNWETAAIAQGWFAPRYGQRVSAPALRLAARSSAGLTAGYLVVER